MASFKARVEEVLHGDTVKAALLEAWLLAMVLDSY